MKPNKKSSLIKRHKQTFIAIAASLCIMVIAYAFTKSVQKNLGAITGDYHIVKSWTLPSSLDEISGISWIGESTIACIQDEEGTIFIYDLDKKSIAKEIPFAGAGDYEGIVINNNDAYVMRSDGLLYEILNYDNDARDIKTFKTGFDASNNMETLAWNQELKALMTTPKDRDSNSDDYKGVYEISLQTKKASSIPLLKIDMNEKALDVYKHKKIYKTFNPSDVAIHPKTKEIYILEGKDPKLLVYDSSGNLKTLHSFNTAQFPQPEGITFSADGQLYISNEAKDGKATIYLVELQ